jgi:hypothetical protein
MTSQIPACKNCKHYYEEGTIGVIPLCEFHTFERPDYINGHINKIDMIAFDAREKEKYCGREGKNFEMKEFVEEEKDISFWEYFKRFFTYGGITNDFKEQIRKIKLEMEANK